MGVVDVHDEGGQKIVVADNSHGIRIRHVEKVVRELVPDVCPCRGSRSPGQSSTRTRTSPYSITRSDSIAIACGVRLSDSTTIAKPCSLSSRTIGPRRRSIRNRPSNAVADSPGLGSVNSGSSRSMILIHLAEKNLEYFAVVERAVGVAVGQTNVRLPGDFLESGELPRSGGFCHSTLAHVLILSQE